MNDHIVYENIKEKQLSLSTKFQISNSINKVHRGWIKIISPNKTIRLTVVLENIGDFMVRLKDSLEHQNAVVVYDEKSFSISIKLLSLVIRVGIDYTSILNVFGFRTYYSNRLYFCYTQH